MPRTLSSNTSLNTLWGELVYTRARLAGDANATDFLGLIEPLIAEVDETNLGQRRAWMGEIDAQAQCDYLNGRLDDLVVEIADPLIITTKDSASPRVKRYLRQTPYSIVRLGLESEVEVVRSWPESLNTEPEEALRALGQRLAELIAKADTALAAQRKAASARLDHRVRVIVPLIQKANDLRLKVYGLLVGRTEERKLGKYWPDGFFKVSRRSAEEAEEGASSGESASS